MLIIEILSPLPLISREDGKIVLELWKDYLPELLPDYYGNWEPIDIIFNRHELDLILGQWKWPFLAKKINPKVDASIWMRKGLNQRLHSTVIFKIEANCISQSRLLSFLRAASIRLNADFSCIHLLTKAELERGISNKTVTFLDKLGKKLNFFIASKELQKRIPDLYWATILGPPYIEMFGRERILSAPAYSSESLSDKMALLQMTKKMTDVNDSKDVFDAVRSCVKNWLGIDAFYELGKETLASSYNLPVFKFYDT
jgi:hypothetical protein